MNTVLIGNDIFTYNFTGETEYDIVLKSIFLESKITGFVMNENFPVPITTETIVEVHPLVKDDEDKDNPHPFIYANLQKQTLTTTADLRRMYGDLKRNKFGEHNLSDFGGLIIALMSKDTSNVMMFMVKFDSKRLVWFSVSTSYNELETIYDGYNYMPFPGVAIQFKQGTDFCFLIGGQICLGVTGDNKTTDYLVAEKIESKSMWCENKTVISRAVRDAKISLATTAIAHKQMENCETDSSRNFFHGHSKGTQRCQKQLEIMLPSAYTEQEKVNQIFDKNLEDFAKEYGSIMAAAFQRVELEEK